MTLGSEEGGNQDTEDNQLSLRKIEEAAFWVLRSGLDKVFLPKSSLPFLFPPKFDFL
ncbi:MAG: hypothetical protein M3299_08440 [Thermoproteota archaeon]|nr:hypothetical protein [Thermoproteota archaeon]